MTPLFLILALQAAPVSARSPAPATPETTPAQTLEGLEQVYSTTCGQTGILYHAYDDLCDSLSKQIRTYRQKADRDAAAAEAAKRSAIRKRP